jgi:hypothetical protein
LFLAAKYFLELRNEKHKWRTVLVEMAEISKRFDDLEHFLGAKRVITESMVDHITSELIRISNCTCNILDDFTGRSCHVAIKFLGRDGAVETAARSQAGSSHRRDIDDHMQAFSYENNTAFARILSDRQPFFVSNHLRLRSWVGSYKNSHKRWQKSYTATCVVPITSAVDSRDIYIDNTYGFVCVDSKSGGFNKAITPLLLATTASRCVTVLLRLSETENA